ncbi:MAG: phenylalanine--tRNA ligase subunit alpha [Candidatus Zixiibacteriota bacterium]
MSKIDEINKVIADARSAIETAESSQHLEDVNIKYLGRKGIITSILKGIKDLPPEEKKAVGAAANKARGELAEYINTTGSKFKAGQSKSFIDTTLPGKAHQLGAIHPITQTIDQMCASFQRMGFSIARGPQVETDYYNFEALNFPPDHPARDMQDTFYVENDMLLRTHTTSVQSRVLENQKPPIKVIMPGKTYRNEAISARSYCVFHQVDGFYVDEGISMADMKGTLVAFCQDYYGKDTKIRMRPSYFPFTEPSAEVDITCFLCGAKGCRICKYTGWLEILGCGMIDPNVLISANIDPEKYTGFAFGIGVERTVMLKHGITDIRLFYENDVRFLRQFR